MAPAPAKGAAKAAPAAAGKAAAPGKAKAAAPPAAGKAKPAAATAAAKAADIDDIFAAKKPKEAVPAASAAKTAAGKAGGKATAGGKADAAPAAPAAEEDDGFADSRGLRNSAWHGPATLKRRQRTHQAGVCAWWMRRGRRRAPLYRGRVSHLHCGGAQDRPRRRYAWARR